MEQINALSLKGPQRRGNEELELVLIIERTHMKSFLLIFGSCFSPTKYSVVPSSSPSKDERARVPAGGDRQHRKWRSSSRLGSQWKPELSAISEDKMISTSRNMKPERMAKARNEPAGKARRTKSFDGSSDKEFRQTTIPVVIPAFSPTTFIF